ncbi:MAG: hypothetical protein GY797_11960 [Deltaproteobacteria bacterium]|nr:hypothetical protein [Deltaproteobacteria bacterium]
MALLHNGSLRSYPGRSARRGDFGRHIAWYPVKRPAGATGKPSPGDCGKAVRPMSR